VVALLHRGEAWLAGASAALRCAPPELVAAAGRLADEAQARRKELERMTEALAASEGARFDAGAAPGAPVVVRAEGALATPAGLKALAQALAARGRVALVGAVEGERAHLVFARPRGAGVHLGEILREAAALVGGKGGGSPDLAQGSGPGGERLDDALALAARAAGG
jgi:alanyl-tRNA synthetase